MERGEIEEQIRSAFAGVRLESGVSLRQAEAIDAYLEGVTEAEFEALPLHEVTDDWTAIPETELLRDCIAHLDAAGLRYYLPALMLWLLDHYGDENADMTVIGTIFALAFDSEREWFSRQAYDTFTSAQRVAIAQFLDVLPRLVDLDYEDATRVSRSFDRYWGQFVLGSGGSQSDAS